MREHVFHLDPFLAPGQLGEQVCLCGLRFESRFHIERPPKPDEDVSDRIIGEGETVDT
jgi:hypothetical protein